MAGDSLAYHHGSKFTTKDNGNDQDGTNCAVSFQGAWWYHNCHHSNLNGLYLTGGMVNIQGVVWYYWKQNHYSMKYADMKICDQV